MDILHAIGFSGEKAEAYTSIYEINSMHKPLDNLVWLADYLKPEYDYDWQAFGIIEALEPKCSENNKVLIKEAYRLLVDQGWPTTLLIHTAKKPKPKGESQSYEYLVSDFFKNMRRHVRLISRSPKLLVHSERKDLRKAYKILKKIKSECPPLGVFRWDWEHVFWDWEQIFAVWRNSAYYQYAEFFEELCENEEHLEPDAQETLKKVAKVLREISNQELEQYRGENDSFIVVKSPLEQAMFSRRETLTPMEMLDAYLLREEYNDEWAAELLD